MPFHDSPAIARAVVALLRDGPGRDVMRQNAYRLGREMVWGRVAQRYVQSFEQARADHSFVGTKASPIKTLDEQPGQLPELLMVSDVARPNAPDGSGRRRPITHLQNGRHWMSAAAWPGATSLSRVARRFALVLFEPSR